MTLQTKIRGRRGRDCMVVGFTTTYAISAYHHWCCEFESWSGRGVQHYVIKFVSDLRQVFSGSPTNKTDRHDITEILLKVALNTIKQTNKQIKQKSECPWAQLIPNVKVWSRYLKVTNFEPTEFWTPVCVHLIMIYIFYLQGRTWF